MIKITCCIIISLILLLPAINEYQKSRDIFSPVCFFNLFSFASIVPRLLFMKYNVYTATLDNATILRYTFFTGLSIIVVNVVFFVNTYKLSKLYSKNIKQIETMSGRIISLPFIYTVFAIGIGSKAYLLWKSGGLSFIWANINRRSSLLAGNNYINSLEVCLLVATALIFVNYINSEKKKYLWSLLIITIISSFLLLSFGGRAGFVRMFLIILFVVNYYNKSFFKINRLFSFKYIMIILGIVLVIVMIPMVRFSRYSSIYRSPVLWLQTGFKNISSIFENISNVDRDMCTYNIFSKSTKWFGKSYAGLFTAWIPSSLYSNKPPVDDGVYLANLINGYKVAPIMPYNKIPFHSSSPFSSSGIMFANFGLFGIVIGSIIIALVYIASYRRMVNSGRTLRNVMIYGYVMILFGLSIHSIISTLMPILIIIIALRKRKYKFVINRNMTW